MPFKRTRLKSIWVNMIQRCTNSNRNDYIYYGGKGVSVCEEWKNFKSFEAWAIQNGYTDNLTIDRIDSSGDYCNENCRWVNMMQQRVNRGDTRMIQINGESKPLKHWCQEYGISYCAVEQRISRGMDEVRALLTPIKQNCGRNLRGESHEL